MANVRTLQRSFAGGEVSLEMSGRLDDPKYQTGVALCRNFSVKPQGPLENRAGFQYVCAVKDSSKKTRLIPFTYSTTQTMVLEMGDGYFRFHTQGATLLYTAPAAWNTGAGYVVGDLRSNGGTNYYCTTAHTSGTFSTDLAAGKWYALPATLVYEIPSPYAEADLSDIHFVQSADVLTLVHPSYAPRELRRYGATNWQLSTVSFAAAIAAPTGVSAAQTGSGTEYTYSYVVTAFAADEISESVASTAATVACNLYTTGNYNTISWSAVSGASRYNVYKMQGGIHGYIGQTTGLSIVDDNIAPDLSVTPPVYETVFNTTNKYPGAVSYYEQRRAFAGTEDAPQQLWMMKSGTESSMSYSLPIRDDDRISFRVAAREANTIRHIVPLSQLLLLTSAAEWRVTSVNSDAITPNSVSVRPQSYVGASNVQPVIVNSNLLYGAARGGHAYELSYSWQANGFITGDLSLRSTHLFDSYEILDMAYSKAPQPIIWFVSDSGSLLGLTYIPEQQVGSWHQHSTEGGVFESCTVVAEGSEDVLYVVVKRYIDGSYVRYIEFLHTRAFTSLEDAFFVDSGLSYDGTNTGSTTITVSGGTDWTPDEELTLTASAPTFAFPATTDVGDAIVLTDSDGLLYYLTISSTTSTTVAKAYVDRTLVAELRSAAITAWAFARGTMSGLDHLEGEGVNVLVDGAVHPQRTVASGGIALETVGVKVHAGLPIQADIETLPLAVQVDQAIGQGRYKNINKGWLRVYSSSGIWIGPDTDHLVEAKQRTTEPYGSPPALKNGEVPVMLTPSWADSGRVCIRQTDPLPLTIVALTLEVALGRSMAEIQSGYSSMLGGSSTSSVISALAYVGPIMGVMGAIQSGIGAYYSASAARSNLEYQTEMYAINDKTSAINARMAENTAQTILRAGQQEQGRVSLRAGKVKGAQRVSQGARGIQMGVGNAAEEIATTDLMKEIDMLTINANTVRSAWNARIGGVNAQTASVNSANASLMSAASAGSISPFMAAGSSLISSGGAVASSWYKMFRGNELADLLSKKLWGSNI